MLSVQKIEDIGDHDTPLLCTACGRREAAGYVTRYGIYLPHLCTRCWLSGRETPCVAARTALPSARAARS